MITELLTQLYVDVATSKYVEADDLLFLATPKHIIIILTVYWIFVMHVGPAFMKKREPYDLTGILLVYNVIQVVISVYLVQVFLEGFFERGFLPKTCHLNDKYHRKKIIFGIWLYFLAKITELLDTVFFVLRRKHNQVTFLHVYHHMSMVVATWAFAKLWPTHTVSFICIFNSLVHVFMYTYYGLSALGPKVTKYIFWKKYMTKFQLIQFVSILMYYPAAVSASDCPPSRIVIIFVACNTAFFLLLFLNFYRQSYNKKSVKSENKHY